MTSLDGDIVFWTGRDWSRHLGGAALALYAKSADELEKAMAADLAAKHVVDAGLVDVALDNFGQAIPRQMRERITTWGRPCALTLANRLNIQLLPENCHD